MSALKATFDEDSLLVNIAFEDGGTAALNPWEAVKNSFSVDWTNEQEDALDSLIENDTVKFVEKLKDGSLKYYLEYYEYEDEGKTPKQLAKAEQNSKNIIDSFYPDVRCMASVIFRELEDDKAELSSMVSENTKTDVSQKAIKTVFNSKQNTLTVDWDNGNSETILLWEDPERSLIKGLTAAQEDEYDRLVVNEPAKFAEMLKNGKLKDYLIIYETLLNMRYEAYSKLKKEIVYGYNDPE